jgi:hypothetical protein
VQPIDGAGLASSVVEEEPLTDALCVAGLDDQSFETMRPAGGVSYDKSSSSGSVPVA